MISPDDAWKAIEKRDRRFDGAFVFGVRTTGVYCRPSCPARRPHRENVAIYATPDQAERAGFRPCLRCHPASPSGTPAEQAVERARERIDADLEASPTLDELAAEVGLSPYHLQRTFKRIVGLTPREYRDARRLGAFKEKIRKGDTVLGAAFEAGFGSSRGIYERAGKGLGMTPGAYRRGGEGMRIAYTTFGSPLGQTLVAATDRGICAVLLGDTVEELSASLADEFPNATIERDDEGMSRWREDVAGYLDGRSRRLDLPLDALGWRAHRSEATDLPTGEALLGLGRDRWSTAVAASAIDPSYLRPPDAALPSRPLAALPSGGEGRLDSGTGHG